MDGFSPQGDFNLMFLVILSLSNLLLQHLFSDDLHLILFDKVSLATSVSTPTKSLVIVLCINLRGKKNDRNFFLSILSVLLGNVKLLRVILKALEYTYHCTIALLSCEPNTCGDELLNSSGQISAEKDAPADADTQ